MNLALDRPRSSRRPAPVVLLYENETWNRELAAALATRGFAVQALDLRQATFELGQALPPAVYFNRLSPSAAARGHAAALDLGRALVRKLEADGQRVLNGAEAFEHELSKLRQYLALQARGLAVPRTVVLTAGAELPAAAQELRYPAILKPNTGGSGAGVQVVDSPAEARERLRRAGDGGESWLLQEKVVARDGAVQRLEFIGAELVYAMRVYATNTYNLCPAEACVRPPAQADAGAPQVRFELLPDPDPAVVEAARRVLGDIGLQVGGVEFMVDAAGQAVFLDVNATSVYRADVAAAAGVDPYDLLAQHLRGESAAQPTRHVA